MVLFLSALTRENGWSDLSPVECVTVCTGCFSFEPLAIRHMGTVRASLDAIGFEGTLQFLTSVVRTEEGLAALADLGPFHLTLTIECFTRRAEVLKRSKADLGLDDMERVLGTARQLGIKTDYTYVVGLDSLEDAIAGIARLRDVTSTFPRLQVFQPHNTAMAAFRAPGAERLDYYLEFRVGVESVFADTGLAPQTWENYRSPWYTHFGEQPVDGIRI